MIPLFFILVFACGSHFCAQENNGTILYNGTDFSTVLQNSVNNTSIHQIYVEYGNYSLSNHIILKSHLDLDLSGYYKINNSNVKDVFYGYYNLTDISISGPATIDGNKQNHNSSITFSDIILAAGDNNIKLNDLNLTNSYNWPLNVGGNNIHANNVIGSYSGNGIIFATLSAHDDSCDNCIVHDITDDWGLMAYGGAYRITFTNPDAYNISQDGIGVLSDGNQPTPSHDITIIGGYSHNNGLSGFGISGYSQHAYNVNIFGSISEFNNQNNQWTGNGGYAITNADNVQSSNNLSYKNGNGSNGSSGWYFKNTNYVTSTNDKSIDEGQKSNNSGYGFLLDSGNKGLIIRESNSIDNQVNKTMNIAVNLLASQTDSSIINSYATPNITNVYVPNPSWITNNFDNIN